MLAKRIIVCLDVRDGRTVKGVQFRDLRNAGDPVSLARRYAAAGADELVLLDVTATIEGRLAMREVVSQVAAAIAIPFTVGGGIRHVDDARALLQAGADKVTVNSAALRRPALITDLAHQFGSQAVVVAIDARRTEERWLAHVDGGRTATPHDAVAWAREAQERGAGEVLATSMDRDGTRRGFDVQLMGALRAALRIPLIASGGAGNVRHFVEVLEPGFADAALVAGILHFGETTLDELKSSLREHGVLVR
jgi:cyclase